MRVLHGNVNRRDGAIILDPRDIPSIVSGTKRNAAAGVLTRDHLVVSTVPFSDHISIAAAAGIEIDDVEAHDPTAGRDLRLWLSNDAIVGELWRPDAMDETNLPASRDALVGLARYLKNHPRIEKCYNDLNELDLFVDVMCSLGGPVWRIRENGIDRIASWPETTPSASPA